jgi:hypothetical protein
MQVPSPLQPPFPWAAIGAFSSLLAAILTILVTWLRDRAAGTKRVQILDESSKYLAFLKARQEILPTESLDWTEREAVRLEIGKKIGLIDRYVDTTVTKVIENKVARLSSENVIAKLLHMFRSEWGSLILQGVGVVLTFILLGGALFFGGVIALRNYPLFLTQHEDSEDIRDMTRQLSKWFNSRTAVRVYSSKRQHNIWVGIDGVRIGLAPLTTFTTLGSHLITCESQPTQSVSAHVVIQRELQEIDCDALQPDQPATQSPTSQK